MATTNTSRPQLWAFDLGSVDPQWWDFWVHCSACVPAWEYALGAPTNAGPMILGGAQGSSFPTPRFCSNGGGWIIDSDGPGIQNAGSSWVIPVDPSGNDIFSLNSATVLLVRRRTAALSNSFPFGCRDNLGTLTGRLGGFIPFTDGIIYWDFGGDTAPKRLTWSGYTLGSDVERWAFRAGKLGMAIYFNGTKVASSSTAVTRIRNTSGGQGNFGLGLGDQTSVGDNQTFFFAAVLDTEWTDGQISTWASDPYGPLRMFEMFPASIIPAALGTQRLIYM